MYQQYCISQLGLKKLKNKYQTISNRSQNTKSIDLKTQLVKPSDHETRPLTTTATQAAYTVR